MKLPLVLSLLLAVAGTLPGQQTLENAAVRVELDERDLSVRIIDKTTSTAWTLGAPHVVLMDKRTVAVTKAGDIQRSPAALSYRTTAGLEFHLALAAASTATVEYRFRGSLQPFGAPEMDEVELFSNSLPLGPGPGNYYALPYRMGIQVFPEGEKSFARRMPAFLTSRGYSMSMLGAVKDGSALLVTWDAPHTDVLVDYSGAPKQELTLGLALRSSARSATFQVLGRGGYPEIAKAYREIARQRGYLKTMAEKLKENPKLEALVGAADIKPFTLYNWVPNTRYNPTNEKRTTSNFSFDEVGQFATHLRRDLGLDRAMIIVGGWISGGYDGTHPDVLPAAPESGGNQGLAALAKTVKSLGYLFGLHDNYTDFYRVAPSWNEDYIAKGADGALVPGGIWAGGQAYLICQRKSLELAKRPQNIPGVLQLFSPDVYFIDCLYAMPPRVCQDPHHPLTKDEDLRLRNDLADYARGERMLFGSEEGNEIGVPHAEYFEGILGHKTRSHGASADPVIPLFELVFGDAVPMMTHQGERLGPDNPEQFLDHILYAEMPVYRFGTHLYWTDPSQDFQPPAGSEKQLVFAQGPGANRYDRFIRNTYQVLSSLSRVTATLPMTDHRFLTPNRTVETTRFGQDVEITVNYGAEDYALGDTVLPRFGFLVKSPSLVAFHARQYAGVSYGDPPLFVIRSRDGRPLSIYRGFGDPRVKLGNTVVEVPDAGRVFAPTELTPPKGTRPQ